MSSYEKLLEPENEHFHHVLAFEELYMSSSADKRVQVCLSDFEVDIYPVDHVDWKLIENIFGHLDVDFSSFAIVEKRIKLLNVLRLYLLWLKFGFVRDLDSSWIERRVHILIRADEDDVLEPLKTFFLRQFEKEAFFEVARSFISHTKLLQAQTLFPGFEEPHTGVNYGTLVVHVS